MDVTFDQISQSINAVLNEIGKVIVGKENVLKQIVAAILADGHILLEDNP